MWKDWSRGDRIGVITLAVGVFLGLTVPFLALPAGTPTRGQDLFNGFASAIGTPISVPVWAIVLAAGSLIWLVAKVLRRGPTKIERVIAAPEPAKPHSFWEASAEFKPTDLQKHILRKLRDAHRAEQLGLVDIANKVRQGVPEVENALNKLIAANFVHDSVAIGGRTRYSLSERGLEYVVEKLDKE